MYQDSNMLASIRKVEAAREENAKLDPRRMTAEEKDTLLKKFHPDYRAEQFTELRFGPNRAKRFRWNWRNCWRVNRASCTSSLI